MANSASVGRLLLATILVCMVSKTSGYSYPFSFFNISTDKKDVGFVQIFTCSAKQANLYFQTPADGGGLNQFAMVNGLNQTLNITLSYSTVLVGAPTSGIDAFRPYGLLLSADSEISVIAVKADVGTTDGYLVYPLTNNSVQYFIGGWKALGGKFFTGISIATAYDDTCISIWQVTNGTQWFRISSLYVTNRMTYVERLLNDTTFDTTIYVVNSSKPITVTVGTSCGQVYANTPFCDHMAEVMPPANELGVRYIVPPIVNRTAAAGLFVRVVGTVPGISVSWTNVLGTTTKMGIIGAAQWVDIDTNDASVPIQVDCSDRCLVMLYNKGREIVKTEKAYTDPFTMIIAPVDHFSNFSCFATASFSYSATVRTDFYNWLAVVTVTSNINNILLDGVPLNTPLLNTIGSYVVAVVYLQPGFHSLTSGNAPFGAYVYGHSRFFDSTSAYGYPVVYKMSGTPVDSTWTDATNSRAALTANARTQLCQTQAIVNGSYILALAPSNVYRYITLDVYVPQATPVTLTPSCVEAYVKAFRNLMISAYNTINYLLCTQSICQSLSGSGGAVVATGNATIQPISMYVAIDTTTLENQINFDTQAISGTSSVLLTGVHVTVPYIGSLTTNAAAFGQCRQEIRNFLIPFINWFTLVNNGFNPKTFAQISSTSPKVTALQNQLIANNSIVVTPQGCPPINFNKPTFTYSTCS